MTEEDPTPRWDPKNPFERLKKMGDMRGESRKANDALRDYYDMGSGRALRKLLVIYKRQAEDDPQTIFPPTPSWTTLSRWSGLFHWKKRVAAQKDMDEAERAALWAQRRLEVQEKDWEQSEKLRGLAGKILDEGPLFIKQQRRFVKGEEGKPDQVIITMALNGALGVKAAEAGSKLARLAAEMETGREKIDIILVKEVEGLLDVAAEVLDERSYERLIAALSGAAGGEAAAEKNNPAADE